MPNMEVLLIAEMGRSARIFQLVLALKRVARISIIDWESGGIEIEIDAAASCSRDNISPGDQEWQSLIPFSSSRLTPGNLCYFDGNWYPYLLISVEQMGVLSSSQRTSIFYLLVWTRKIFSVMI